MEATQLQTNFWRALTSAMLGASAAAGCEGQSCTAIGCSDPVDVYVTSKVWLTGDYTVGVSTPGGAFTCSLPVQAFHCEAAVGAGGQSGVGCSLAECTQTAGALAEQWEVPRIYFDDGVRIDLSWAASELELTLHYEGNELLRERVTPTYAKSYPNGRECDGDPCLNSQVTLEAHSPKIRY